MRTSSLWPSALIVALGTLIVACAPPAPASPTAPAPAAPAVKPKAADPAKPAQLYVFSNASPQIAVIDTSTNAVARTADVPGLKNWTWNDDNNYFDGVHLWVGARDPDTNDAEVLLLNLDTLVVTSRIPVGKETNTLYIGKPTKDGRLFVGKHASWEMSIIDTRSRQVLDVVSVPTNAGDVGKPPDWAVCDADASIGPDGVERVFYPTRDGDTVVALDSKTARPVKIANFPDFRPLMLTAAPDGTVWVQEAKTNTNAVLNPVTLDVLARFSTGRGPLLAAFSPDGKLGYITGNDTPVTVVDSQTHRVLRNVEVGANAQLAAAHPNGRAVYVTVTRENAVAVIDTATWQVTTRIDLGTSPNGIFVRPGA